MHSSIRRGRLPRPPDLVFEISVTQACRQWESCLTQYRSIIVKVRLNRLPIPLARSLLMLRDHCSL